MFDVAVTHAAYGTATVLHNISFSMHVESVSIVGRNGMGKSTLCRVVTGMHSNAAGSIRLHGRELLGRRPTQIGRSGIGYVPQGRRVFATLTVDEHFAMLGSHQSKGWPTERLYTLFPKLKERRRHLGGNLSGGEQQMLAIARAIAVGPKLLIMDEPSEGLAPVVVNDLIKACGTLTDQEEINLIVVEQNLHVATRLADRILVMAHGEIVADLSTAEFHSRPDLQERYLGVSRSG